MGANTKYDVGIVGGGLAGLALSILLARKNIRVVLFEKEAYPFHKVCGEYISMESWDFLLRLGVPLNEWQLPVIHELHLTGPNGESIREKLPLGGFGISRYKLDATLAGLARKEGVTVFENTKVHDIRFVTQDHLIETSGGTFTASVACACYGKKSNLDVKWHRYFLREKENRNYVGVKYHVKTNLPAGQISLHNFNGGYCGISKIEDDRYCLCYLTKSDNLKNSHQSIPEMEANILSQNPVLRKLLIESEKLTEPVTIAQISFSPKTQIENHVLCLGDAAGMIAPLCGNGMSMALHASKIASQTIQAFLNNQITRKAMENAYRKKWRKLFGSRLRTGRIIQRFFGNAFWAGLLIQTVKLFPFMGKAMIRETHGEVF